MAAYWVNGARAVNGYPAFYQTGNQQLASTAGRDESGGNAPTSMSYFTGCSADGTTKTNNALGDSNVQIGDLGGTDPLDKGENRTNADGRNFYALSQRFLVRDTTGPQVASVAVTSAPPTNKSYKIGDVIEILVTFNEDVALPTGNAGIKIALTNDRTAEYDSTLTANHRGQSLTDAPDKEKQLVFSYPIVEDDTGGALTIPAHDATNGGMTGNYFDTASTPNRTPGGDMDYNAVDPSQTVDATRPTVTDIAITSEILPGQNAHKVGDTLAITFIFDEEVNVEVTGTEGPYFDLRQGYSMYYDEALSTTARGDTNDSDRLKKVVFSYIIAADADGEPSYHSDTGPSFLPGQNSIQYEAGSSIKDGNGNAVTRTFTGSTLLTAAEALAHPMDARPPTIVTDGITIAPKSPAVSPLGIGEVMRVSVDFSENVTVDTTSGTPTITVTLHTGGDVTATYNSTDSEANADRSVIFFDYAIVEGNLDANGPDIGPDMLALGGGTIKDGAKNDADLRHLAVADVSAVEVDGVKPTVTITGTFFDSRPGVSFRYPSLDICDSLSGEEQKTCGIDSDAPVVLTFTWSKPVTGFDVTDIVLTAADFDPEASLLKDIAQIPGTEVYTHTIIPTGAGDTTNGMTNIVVSIAAGTDTTEVVRDPREQPQRRGQHLPHAPARPGEQRAHHRGDVNPLHSGVGPPRIRD